MLKNLKVSFIVILKSIWFLRLRKAKSDGFKPWFFFCMTPHVIFGGKYMYVSHLKEKIKTCFTIACMYILLFFSRLHCTAFEQNYIYVKAKKKIMIKPTSKTCMGHNKGHLSNTFSCEI